MWKGLIIACLAGTPVPDCQPNKPAVLVDVFRPPTKEYRSINECQFESMAFAADVVVPGTVVKIYCSQSTKQGNPGA